MLTYTGEVRDGVIKLNSEKFKREVLSCFPGQPFILRVEKVKKKRSNNQNEYYWGVVIEYVREAIRMLGFDLTKDETHDFLKARFNSVEIAGLIVPKSTTSLSTEEFNRYIETIVKWVAERFHIVIPPPEN